MGKKLMMLALAAVSAAAFVLPATASAIVPLHVTGAPSYPDNFTIAGGVAKLSTENGLTVECQKVKSIANTNFTNSTEGNLRLTFESECKESLFKSKCNSVGEPAGSIATNQLTFRLATIRRTQEPEKETQVPGVEIRPPFNAEGKPEPFATFVCGGGLVNVTVTGNGILGRIEFPACGAINQTEARVVFQTTAHGKQRYTTLESTEEEITLLKGSEMAAQEGTGTLTFSGARNLVCT